jgi:prefoldin beta subunit
MSEQELPPWVREQISRLQQLQQNLQAIMMQKQQLEVEMAETDRALQELKKASPDDAIYKNAGSVLIKAKKEEVLKELEEKKCQTHVLWFLASRRQESKKILRKSKTR